eukprot:SAG11_NODE_5137_length_1655_cov_1.176735_2_plen_128_part_00
MTAAEATGEATSSSHQTATSATSASTSAATAREEHLQQLPGASSSHLLFTVRVPPGMHGGDVLQVRVPRTLCSLGAAGDAPQCKRRRCTCFAGGDRGTPLHCLCALIRAVECCLLLLASRRRRAGRC